MPTAQTNERLCALAQAGDEQARSKLIENNIPFIRGKAEQFARTPSRAELFSACGIGVDDLIQAGSIGLWRAIAGFDPSRENNFRTYAAPAIEHAMTDLVRQYGRDVVWRLRTDQAQPRQIVYLDKTMKDGDGEETVGDLIVSPYAKLPEQICIEQETLAELHEAMDTLSERENMYIRYRFGFIDDAHSLAETAEHFHLSVSRAKGIERPALKALKHELRFAIPERAFAKAEDQLTEILVDTGELHAVELRLKMQKKRGKKVTAAVYEYLADCDGKWGELSYNLKDDTAEILRLADWDTMISHRFAIQAIEYLKVHSKDALPDKIVLTFIGQEQRSHHL